MENELSILILALVGAIIQVLFRYAPILSVWYEAQSKKALIMLAFIAVVSLAYFGLSCTPFAVTLGIVIACSTQGALELGTAFVYILISQQTTFLLTGARKTEQLGG